MLPLSFGSTLVFNKLLYIASVRSVDGFMILLNFTNLATICVFFFCFFYKSSNVFLTGANEDMAK